MKVYTKTIPFKDLKGRPQNMSVHFHLGVKDVVKILRELKTIFDWQESIQGPPRELNTDEVIDFYNAFEAVLLAAWGEPSDDGLHFRRSGRYDFEESILFEACMDEFLSNPPETNKLMEAIIPDGMDELIKKQAEALEQMAQDSNTPEDLQARIRELQAQLEANNGNTSSTSSTPAVAQA